MFLLRRFFRKYYKMFRSTVGLFILLLIYSFTGAAIFEAIESPNEDEVKGLITQLRAEIIDKLYNTSRSGPITYQYSKWYICML